MEDESSGKCNGSTLKLLMGAISLPTVHWTIHREVESSAFKQSHNTYYSNKLLARDTATEFVNRLSLCPSPWNVQHCTEACTLKVDDTITTVATQIGGSIKGREPSSFMFAGKPFKSIPEPWLAAVAIQCRALSTLGE